MVTASRSLTPLAFAALVALAPCVAQAQQPITPGTRLRGSLGEGDSRLGTGEWMDTYTIVGRAGQRLVIRMTSTAFDAYLFIRGPSDFSQDNDDEAQGDNNARLDVQLPADGTYRIVATSYRAGEQGDYALEVSEGGAGAVAAAPAQTGGGAHGGTIAVGQTQRGTLGAGDETLRTGEFQETWRFAGRRGQQVVVRLASTDFDPYLLARGPGGFSEENDDDPSERGSRNSRLELTLPADGEYRFVATSYRAGETGGYAISVEGCGASAPVASTGAPAGSVSAGSIAAGQSVSGRLERGDAQLRSGEFMDSYTLSGTRGQRLEIRLNSTEFDPYVIIRGPGGYSEFNDDDVEGGTANSHLVVTLPTDGTYQVIATTYRPGESGAYQLSVGSTSAVAAGAGAATNAAALTMGQSATGTLATGDDTLQTGEFVDRYSFAGHRGDRVGVNMTSRAFDSYLLLIAPSGRQEENDDAANGVTDSRIETVLAEEGTYTILATSYARGGTGDYQLTVRPLGTGERAVAQGAQVLPGDAAAVAAGAPQSGRLESGDRTLTTGEFVDYYRFAGRRGQTVTVEMASSDFDSYVIVQAPDGSQQENDDASQGTHNSRLTWVLPTDGSYAILATSYRPRETGAYSVRWSLGVAASPTRPGAVAAAPPATTTRAGQRVWAVMVGISDYAGRANNLPYTAEDAVKLGQTLQREGVLADGSIVLTDADATYDRVHQAFEQVARLAGPDDLFLFFYSGHGTQIPGQTSETEPDGRNEAIVLRDHIVTDDEMGQWFQGVHSRMALIALDACFSGGFARNVITRPGIMGLFSSEEDLTSAVAGKFQAGGYLSHFLRTALAGDADENHDGTITAGELSAYLRHEFASEVSDVEAETMDRQRNYQFLVVERGGVKIDDLVLAVPH